MPVSNLSSLFQPQFVAASAAALVFATPGALVAVPAQFSYQIGVLRVANVTGAPVTFKCWRVNSGAANDDQHVVIPTINIPIPTQTFAYFDVQSLWGAVLMPGDAIWALAGSASALTISGDGIVSQL